MSVLCQLPIIESIRHDICSCFITKDTVCCNKYLMNRFYPHFLRQQVLCNDLSLYVYISLSLLLYLTYEKHFLAYWQIWIKTKRHKDNNVYRHTLACMHMSMQNLELYIFWLPIWIPTFMYYFNVTGKSCDSVIFVFTVVILMETNYSRKSKPKQNQPTNQANQKTKKNPKKTPKPKPNPKNFPKYWCGQVHSLFLFFPFYLFFSPITRYWSDCITFVLCEHNWNRIVNATLLHQIKKKKKEKSFALNKLIIYYYFNRIFTWPWSTVQHNKSNMMSWGNLIWFFFNNETIL